MPHLGKIYAIAIIAGSFSAGTRMAANVSPFIIQISCSNTHCLT